MTIASGTATRTELETLSDAAYNLVIMLRQIKDGYGNVTNPGRFTATQIDNQVTALYNAIMAANA